MMQEKKKKGNKKRKKGNEEIRKQTVMQRKGKQIIKHKNIMKSTILKKREIQ